MLDRKLGNSSARMERFVRRPSIKLGPIFFPNRIKIYCYPIRLGRVPIRCVKPVLSFEFAYF